MNEHDFFKQMIQDNLVNDALVKARAKHTVQRTFAWRKAFAIAAASFAGKQLLHEPAMNLWVALAFALVLTIGWVPVFLISFVMLAIWIGVSVYLIRRRKNA